MARKSIVEDARNVCVLFIQEETFLACVLVLILFYFYVGGVLPGGYLQCKRKSKANFNLKQFTYLPNE